MPILTIQKRLRPAGRIRVGAKVPTKEGKQRPSKLESFRFTSPDETSIQAVADVYGGDVQPWDGAAVGKQFEVYTKATSLDVTIPPADIAFSQFFEHWANGLCQRRCDGERNVLTDTPCSCNPDSPECRPTTRINVILTALEGIGVWRLESRGWNSAAELAGSMEVLKQLHSRGVLVPGRLQLEQRQSKSLGDDGKVNTYNFAVPTLDFKFSIGQIGAGTTHAALASGPPVTTIPRDELPSTPSVAEQLQAAQAPKPERPARSNAAATLPRTGAKPRGMSTGPSEPIDVEVVDKPKTLAASDDRTPGGASKSSLRKLMAVIRGAKDVPDDDESRHEWAALAVNHPVASFNDLNQSEISHLIDVASGKKPLIPDVPGTYPPGGAPF